MRYAVDPAVWTEELGVRASRRPSLLCADAPGGPGLRLNCARPGRSLAILVFTAVDVWLSPSRNQGRLVVSRLLGARE